MPGWRTSGRNVTRELFHEMVRRLRLNGIECERVIAEVESAYAEMLSDADAETARGGQVPKGWAE